MPHEFDNLPRRADHEPMEALVAKLEADVVEIKERLVRIEARLDDMPTKADLEKVSSSHAKWTVGTVGGFTVLTVTVMSFVLNFAAPPRQPILLPAPAASQTQSAPIIITIPPGALQWQPAPEGAQPRKP